MSLAVVLQHIPGPPPGLEDDLRTALNPADTTRPSSVRRMAP
jgi:hypothetical protein